MDEELRLDIGGPLYRIEKAAHVEPLVRLIPLLVAFAWAPLVGLALLRRGGPESLIRDLSVHARLLLAMPLLLVAQRLLDRAAGVTLQRLFGEGFIPAGSAASIRALIRSVERWRDSAIPEVILAAAALSAGVAALVGWLPPAGLFAGVGEARYDAVRIWYGLASLPLFQFVMWRSLFRYLLWLRVLVGVANLRLRLLPAHADRRGGIDFVKLPTLVYSALALLATSCVLCGGWATKLMASDLPLATFRAPFLLFVGLGLLVSFAPLARFTPQLLGARIAGARGYGALVSDYNQRFDARWIARPDRGELLGTPDIQSLCDLSSTYQENIQKIGLILFNRVDWVLLAVATALPAIPLIFTQGPAEEVVKRLAHLFVGAMP